MNYVESFNLLGVEAKQIPCLKSEGVPTVSTEGAVGCFYMDTLTGTLYKCTAVSDGIYTWTTFEGEKGDPGNDGVDGTNGVIFTPHVSADGTLSWTNDGELTNPDPVNIVGNVESIGEIVQTMGDSELAVMSQKAVTDALANKASIEYVQEAVSAATVEVDTALTQEGKAADAKAVGNLLTDLGLYGLVDFDYSEYMFPGKVCSRKDNGFASYDNAGITCVGIPCEAGELVYVDMGSNPSHLGFPFFYDANGVYLGTIDENQLFYIAPSDGSILAFNIQNVQLSTVVVKKYSTIDRCKPIEEQLSELEPLRSLYGAFSQGTYYTEATASANGFSGAGIHAGTLRICIPRVFYANKDILFSIKNGYQFFIGYFMDETLDNYITQTAWLTSDYVVPKGSYYFVSVAKSDNSKIVPTEGTAITARCYATIDDVVDMNDDNILARNKDIEHIVNASCKYGVYRNNAMINKLFSMLVTTDIHKDQNQLRYAIDYLNGMGAIDCGICLGDIQAGNYSENDGTWYTSVVNDAEKPFYTVLGNHDLGNSKTANISATPAMAFNKFISPTLETIGDTTITTPYYSRKFDDYGIYLICLNSFDVPDDLDDEGNYMVTRGSECFSQTQIDWFIDELSNIPAGYQLIIATHSVIADYTATECNFTQPGGSLLRCGQPFDSRDLIPDIVNAWMCGTSISKIYTPTYYKDVFDTITINADFSERGVGEFVCYLVGHGHVDVVAKATTYPDQTIIGVCATAAGKMQNYNSDLPRESGTKAENAITVFSVDKDNKQIRLVRVGSNYTINMVNRTHITIDY